MHIETQITIIIQLNPTKPKEEISHVEPHILNTFKSSSKLTLNCLHISVYIPSALWLRTEAY